MRILRRVQYILLCLCVSLTVFGQEKQFNLNQGSIKQKEYFTEIPFEFLKGQIIVNVSIKGENYRFSIDTGAPTIISDKLYNQLGLSTVHKVQMTDSQNAKDSIHVAMIKSLKVGDIEIENSPALVMNSENLIYKCLHIDGNIGSNSLRNSVIQFSLPNKVVRITDKAKKLKLKRRNSQRLKLFFGQSSPYFFVKLKGKDKGRLQLLFDSGMEGDLDLALRHFFLFRKYNIFKNIEGAKGNNSVGFLGIAKDTLRYRMTVPKIKFGKIELQNLTISTTRAVDSRVGTDFLKYAEITLDYAKKRIYFTPIGHRIKDVASVNKPIQFSFKNGKLCIGFVWDTKQVPNVSLGDEVVYINDISCRGKKECELLFLLNKINSKEIKLVTEDKVGKQHISIIKRK